MSSRLPLINPQHRLDIPIEIGIRIVVFSNIKNQNHIYTCDHISIYYICTHIQKSFYIHSHSHIWINWVSKKTFIFHVWATIPTLLRHLGKSKNAWFKAQLLWFQRVQVMSLAVSILALKMWWHLPFCRRPIDCSQWCSEMTWIAPTYWSSSRNPLAVRGFFETCAQISKRASSVYLNGNKM